VYHDAFPVLVQRRSSKRHNPLYQFAFRLQPLCEQSMDTIFTEKTAGRRTFGFPMERNVTFGTKTLSHDAAQQTAKHHLPLPPPRFTTFIMLERETLRMLKKPALLLLLTAILLSVIRRIDFSATVTYGSCATSNPMSAIDLISTADALLLHQLQHVVQVHAPKCVSKVFQLLTPIPS
jgi:hypothetical protein